MIVVKGHRDVDVIEKTLYVVVSLMIVVKGHREVDVIEKTLYVVVSLWL